MEWLFDPNMWAGLLTLVVLEVVLGIDNLVFIAILADKLPAKQRDKARVIGLTLALVMRLLLLSLISWLVTLTTPLFSFFDFFQPSGKDLILLGGGIFLLFKATTELHERLENHSVFDAPKRVKIAFWKVVVQIVALDAVFSLDAVITAVGMVQSLPLMMAAVIIAVGIMLLASKPLTNFVSAHPSVVVLCLGFLLMIGFSLVAEAFHYSMPKGYLYAAIGFSIIIEAFNQVISRNKKKQESRKPLRMRTAETVLRLLNSVEEETDEVENISELEQKVIQSEAQNMLYSVLTLTDRSVRSIMTPRTEVIWIDIEDDIQTIRDLVENSSHSVFPVRYKENDEIVGVARDKELLTRFQVGSNVKLQDIVRAPLVVQESIGVLRLMEMMRKSSAKLSFVTNEYGAILGIITLQDIFEAIAGDFPDADEVPELLIESENVWQVDAGMDLHRLEFILETDELVNNSGGHVTTLGGYITQQIGKVPKEGEKFTLGNLNMEVLVASARKIERVRVTKQKADASE